MSVRTFALKVDARSLNEASTLAGVVFAASEAMTHRWRAMRE